jgi:hypothetical protein
VAKKEAYALTLRQTPEAEWRAYLLRESGLPGPRGNLELVQAAADEGALEQFLAWLAYTPEGRRIRRLICPSARRWGWDACGPRDTGWKGTWCACASYPTRWRVMRVAMALQRLGERHAALDRRARIGQKKPNRDARRGGRAERAY